MTIQQEPNAIDAFRTYAFPRVTAARLIAAGLLTVLIAGTTAFLIAGMPGRTGLVVALGLGVVVAALWIVVLRQPSAVTVGKDVVIRFPIGSRRYASNDLLEVASEVRRGGFLFLGMHVSATTFWTFRMGDGRAYTVPVPADAGEPG